MSFFSDLDAAISSEFTKLKTEVEAVIVKFEPVIEATAEELGQAALQAVLAQAPLLISGAEKLSGAVASISATLAAQGKSAALSLIETAAQASYNTVASSKSPS